MMMNLWSKLTRRLLSVQQRHALVFLVGRNTPEVVPLAEMGRYAPGETGPSGRGVVSVARPAPPHFEAVVAGKKRRR